MENMGLLIPQTLNICYACDVLYLTDTGKIMKIVFSTSGSQPSTFDPVVAEEITVFSKF